MKIRKIDIRIAYIIFPKKKKRKKTGVFKNQDFQKRIKLFFLKKVKI